MLSPSASFSLVRLLAAVPMLAISWTPADPLIAELSFLGGFFTRMCLHGTVQLWVTLCKEELSCDVCTGTFAVTKSRIRVDLSTLVYK